MSGWSAEIANEFIRRAMADRRPLTQMQLQKLVYIAHGWNLAINGEPLTVDSPQAWEYGPVYRDLYRSLSRYGRGAVTKEITVGEIPFGDFEGDAALEQPARADLTPEECAIVDRVYRDYSKYHAYQLSALTHRDGTPWTHIYDGGNGKFSEIPNRMIQDHFIALARNNAA